MKKRCLLVFLVMHVGVTQNAGPVNMVVTKEGDRMISLGITDKSREEMADRLNVLLANEYVLYTKTLKFHWNVVGPFFGQLHGFLDKQYHDLLEFIDSVAERVRSLGHVADGTLKEFSEHSTLTEDPGVNPADLQMLRILLVDHEAIIRQIRADIDLSASINDMGTNNFLCDLVEKHEKMAWMLRAHLQ